MFLTFIEEKNDVPALSIVPVSFDDVGALSQFACNNISPGPISDVFIHPACVARVLATNQFGEVTATRVLRG